MRGVSHELDLANEFNPAKDSDAVSDQGRVPTPPRAGTSKAKSPTKSKSAVKKGKKYGGLVVLEMPSETQGHPSTNTTIMHKWYKLPNNKTHHWYWIPIKRLVSKLISLS